MKKIFYAFLVIKHKKCVNSESLLEPETISNLSSFERQQILKTGGNANSRWNPKPKVKIKKPPEDFRKLDNSEFHQNRPDFEIFIENELDRLNLSRPDFVPQFSRSVEDDREFYGHFRGCFYPDGVTRVVANGDCSFDTMETSPHFEQAFTHCSGRPLRNGTWYRALTPFEGKENSLYFPIDLTTTTGGVQGLSITDARNYCDSISEDYGQEVHLACPGSADENFYLWWHHPNQPFNYPATTGVWTGITRDYQNGGYTDWTCAGLY